MNWIDRGMGCAGGSAIFAAACARGCGGSALGIYAVAALGASLGAALVWHTWRRSVATTL